MTTRRTDIIDGQLIAWVRRDDGSVRIGVHGPQERFIDLSSVQWEWVTSDVSTPPISEPSALPEHVVKLVRGMRDILVRQGIGGQWVEMADAWVLSDDREPERIKHEQFPLDTVDRIIAEPEQLARRFHELYEELAPAHGYETRKESAVPWDDVPAQNKALMIDVCAHIISERA